MQNIFIHPNFLLDTERARALYHRFASDAPIIDYHTHLSARAIAENRRFTDITEAWLEGDHYKWRAMRAAGVSEVRITGDAPSRDKFQAWALTVPQLLGNPLYHWTHLELKRYFDIDVLLGPDTADAIWHECNQRLAQMTCRDMMRNMNVSVVCTTDDPADSLDHHRAVADDRAFPIRVLPSWRPDAALGIDAPDAFNAWVARLGAAAGRPIVSFDDFWAALQTRHAEYHRAGCRLSDHGLDRMYAGHSDLADAAIVFAKARSGSAVSPNDLAIWRSALLYEFGKMDAALGWTQQFHLGPLRNCRSRLLQRAGRDAGADSMNDEPYARELNRFLDRLDSEGALARTIVYNLNPRDNAMIVSTLGNFEDGSVPGKMQFGSAWWFNDHIEGIESQLTLLARMGVLSRFVGMLTDSRSFLSFPRHEYFRRILCNLLGREMSNGRLPDDIGLVGQMVGDICYGNAARYFGFEA